MEGACPVVVEIGLRYSFEFNFMALAVLFAGMGVNDLRLVELWSSG